MILCLLSVDILFSVLKALFAFIARSAETQVVDVHVTTLDSSAESGKSEKAEKDEKACEERSLMVLINVFLIQAGRVRGGSGGGWLPKLC